jgi:hypothetical protein
MQPGGLGPNPKKSPKTSFTFCYCFARRFDKRAEPTAVPGEPLSLGDYSGKFNFSVFTFATVFLF